MGISSVERIGMITSRSFATRVGLMVTAALAPFMLTSPANAQKTSMLIVTGIAGAPQFAKSFKETTASLADAAKQKWGVADSSLIVLGEDPALDPAHVKGKSTKEEVAAAFLRL